MSLLKVECRVLIVYYNIFSAYWINFSGTQNIYNIFIHGSNPLKFGIFVILDVCYHETLTMLAKTHVDILCMNMTAKVNKFFIKLCD